MKRAVVPAPTPEAIERLMAYHWPGNVRELENAVERSLILNPGGRLYFKEIGTRLVRKSPEGGHPAAPGADEVLGLDDVMARHILRVLTLCDGRVEGQRGAARLLGIKPSTLRKRMTKLGVPFGRRAAAQPKG
jgi:DNA-binding NtrC family response regulator